MRYLTISFCTVFKFSIYFTLTAHLNLDTKISSEILDLYLDILKFTTEKGEPHIQVVPNILKSFPVTELSISFES